MVCLLPTGEAVLINSLVSPLMKSLSQHHIKEIINIHEYTSGSFFISNLTSLRHMCMYDLSIINQLCSNPCLSSTNTLLHPHQLFLSHVTFRFNIHPWQMHPFLFNTQRISTVTFTKKKNKLFLLKKKSYGETSVSFDSVQDSIKLPSEFLRAAPESTYHPQR